MNFEETLDSGKHVEMVIPGFKALFLDFQCVRHISALSLSQDLFRCLELTQRKSLYMWISINLHVRSSRGCLWIKKSLCFFIYLSLLIVSSEGHAKKV